MDLHHLLLAGFTGALKCAPVLLLQDARYSLRQFVVLSTDFPQESDASRHDVPDRVQVRAHAHAARTVDVSISDLTHDVPFTVHTSKPVTHPK